MTEWLIKTKEFSGEMYDLTASTSISKTGGFKFEAAIENGISDTFKKYLQELDYMTDDQTDDKFYKRMDRLTFLENCEKFDRLVMTNTNKHAEMIKLKNRYLEKLFSFTCNYLNGNNGINQYTKQPITVILSGGNVTTIYINLLKNLISPAPKTSE